jgi:segregation and condensation protein A
VQLWDLVAAFGRVMTAIGQGPSRHEVTYDDTPIELWADEIVAALHSEGPTTFQALFAGRSNRAEVVGLFLALLELVRSHRIKAEQERAFGTIYLFELVEVPDEPAAAAPSDETVPMADGPSPEPAAATEAPTERDHEQAE